jgi:hypothetical protein
VLVISGTTDKVTARADARVLAKTTGGKLMAIEGGDHVPEARHPVAVNLAIREFADPSFHRDLAVHRADGRPRALYVSLLIAEEIGREVDLVAHRIANSHGGPRIRSRPSLQAKLSDDRPDGRVPAGNRGPALARLPFVTMTTKERLHKLVDELSEPQAGAALVIVERRRDDPMLQALAAAPVDDEPSGAEEDASAAEALASYRRGEGASSEETRRELGLD